MTPQLHHSADMAVECALAVRTVGIPELLAVQPRDRAHRINEHAQGTPPPPTQLLPPPSPTPCSPCPLWPRCPCGTPQVHRRVPVEPHPQDPVPSLGRGPLDAPVPRTQVTHGHRHPARVPTPTPTLAGAPMSSPVGPASSRAGCPGRSTNRVARAGAALRSGRGVPGTDSGPLELVNLDVQPLGLNIDARRGQRWGRNTKPPTPAPTSGIPRGGPQRMAF